MLQLDLTRQEKNILLVIVCVAMVGMVLSFLSKTLPSKGKIYVQASFGKPRIVDINKASKEQLISLPGIGPKTADKIIDYRMKNGEFSSIDELKQIYGIGDKKLERIRKVITIDSDE